MPMKAGSSIHTTAAHRTTSAHTFYPTRSEFIRHALLHTFRPPLLAIVGLYALVVPLYNYLLPFVAQWSEPVFFTAYTVAAFNITNMVVLAAFFLVERSGLLVRYQLPRTARMMPSRALLVRSHLEAVGMQIAFSPVLMCGVYWLAVHERSIERDAALPSLWFTFVYFVVSQALNETLFYAVHRTLHEFPWLYRNIHKKHHQFVGTTAVAAEYAHLVEQVVANALPTLITFMLYPVHPTLFITWIIWRLEETLEAHSGYDFSTSWLGRLGLLNGERARFHDYHHTANMGNYGPAYVIDWLLGTMDQYARTELYRSKEAADVKTKQNK